MEPNLGGRIMSIAGGVYTVDDGVSIRRAFLRGRLKQTSSRIPSVGDIVRMETVGDEVRIISVNPRQSALARHGVAKRREQVIVANVDQVAIVVAERAPAPDLLMVDRLLAMAELSEVDAFLVVNKTDLREFDVPVIDLATYHGLGLDLVFTSTVTSKGLSNLANCLTDRVSVFTGQSGVGKSSLLNALIPELNLRVGAVGRRKGRGRHTTVGATLHRYPGGGYVADTPGLQYLALWEDDPSRLQTGFKEIQQASADCRFGDCRHQAEPGCAVLAAIPEGGIDRRRLASFHRLLSEAAARAPY